jgi:hypothetical protein
LIEGKIFLFHADSRRKITLIFINQFAGLFRDNLREHLFRHYQIKAPLWCWAIDLSFSDLAGRPF